MRNGFRVGRVFGIDIRVDWSWLFILFLVTWNLRAAFEQSHRDWGPVGTWGTALVAALLFFVSVLAHELAHSLVASARGIPVRNITLYLFGGVSNLQHDPDSPRAEFLMAVVGPLTSLVLGGILLAVSGLALGAMYSLSDPLEAIGRLGPLSTLVLWLGSVNVTLGLFNLIPGFPLDGGRVLRSILWAAVGDLRRATRWASGAGQVIAWLMIVSGISMAFGMQIPLLGTGFVSGLWLAFIGWFLNSASAQSYRQLVVHDILEGVPVERIMRIDPPTVSPSSSVSSLVHDRVMSTDDSGFPVLEDGSLVGIVTLEDVRTVPRGEWDTTNVRQIMTPSDRLVTVMPGEDGGAALDKLMQNDFRQLPVLNGNGLVGLFRRRDIVKWLQVHAKLFGD
jgi:Zn-dependent protease/predicted transcriptional regulator